jgi:protein-disulfide isomerase
MKSDSGGIRRTPASIPLSGKKTATALLAAFLILRGAAQAQTVEKSLAALGSSPTLGSSDAHVAVVEFSDFQCSYCKKFWADTLPPLKEIYINKGQARFTYRHFAILGKSSQQAAQATECAGEQGKFWGYHDRLFANQGGLAFTDSKLNQYARELRVNGGKFAECLNSGRYRRKVEEETAVAASLGARGTPTFFVNNRLLVGAQPFEVFRAVIEAELKAKVTKEKQTK